MDSTPVQLVCAAFSLTATSGASMTELTRGAAGRIWRLDLGTDRYAVKELFLESDEESVRREVAVTAHLQAAGIRLPASVPGRDGRFLDYADDQVERAVKARRKGVLAAYRDATLFKVIYGWGLRRTETAKLDLLDWGRNPAAAEFGRYGMLHVRYGKAVRGQPPRRRNVSSVMGWAVDAVADYVDNIRPRFG